MTKSDLKLLAGVDRLRTSQVLSLFPVIQSDRVTGTVLSRMNIGYIYVDHQRVIREINQKTEELLGIQAQWLMNRPLHEICFQLDSTEPQLRALLSFFEHLFHEQQLEIHWSGSGQMLELLLQSFPIHEGNHQEGTWITIQDQTAYRLLEKQVRHSNRLAQIGKIAAVTAHEIRNPLTSIQGFLQVIGKRLNENEQVQEQNYLEMVFNEINRINHLLGEFLLLSKPRDSERMEVHLQKVVEDLVPIIEADAHRAKVEFRFCKPRSIPHVIANEGLIKQVILNLCKNGIEAMDSGGLLTLMLDYCHGNNSVCIHVKDEGPGISQSDLERVFEPFYTTKENGTGLGLAVCKNIIQEFGGKIEIESNEQGTNFIVSLPLEKAH